MFDMRSLKKVAELGDLAPRTMASFKAPDEAGLADGAIPKKYKELMAIAVALPTQCAYCIDVHRKAALAAGASKVKLSETIFIAMALRAGAAPTHGTHLLTS